MIQEAILSGVHFMLLFLILVIIYALWRISLNLLFNYFFKKEIYRAEVKIITLSAIFFLIIFTISFFIPTLGITWVNKNVDRSTTFINSQLLMDWDKKVFSVYMPLWMQDRGNSWRFIFDALTPILIYTYRLLTVVLSFVFLWLLATHHRQFYQMFWAVILCIILSLPFWYLFPALTPREAFWVNRQNQELPLATKTALNNYQPNDNLTDFLNRKKLAANSPNDVIPITTIPSMHIAWSMVILYFGAFLGWPALVILIPYFILNFTATMFTLQHYALDTIAGLIIAILAILMVKIIYPLKTGVKQTLTTIIQKDLVVLKKWVNQLFTLK